MKRQLRKSARNESELIGLRQNFSVAMKSDKTVEVIDCIASALVDLYFEKQQRGKSTVFGAAKILKNSAA